jgi:prepilin-type N-terminal cleavage/methylation domain-containing protein
MAINKSKYLKGFTLIEMLLVLVIASGIIYMAMGYVQQKTLQVRIDRTNLQMQQILNAGLAYYIGNAAWPATIACLQGVGGAACTQRFLPPTLSSPWGSTYTITSTNSNLYVYTAVTTNSAATASAYARIIAGKLPLAYTTSNVAATPPNQVVCSSNTCYVVASVNIPGQNLNNATAVNFAGVVAHGGCLPVPSCPLDPSGTPMVPEAIVVPVSVSGINDSGNNTNVYPISSFTAYVLPAATPTTTNPPFCTNSYWSNTWSDCAGPATGANARAYWRVCMQIVTERGDITRTRSDMWGNAVSAAAFTRCSIRNEPGTSGFSLYMN